jgi:glycosyltransferase involved in cell wall biosynthesis
MKVIRVTTTLDFGGIERRFVNVSSLEDSKNVLFVAIGKGGWASAEIQKTGGHVKCMELPFQIPSFRATWALYKLFLLESPRVVHTSGAEANFHGLLAAWLARVPVRIGEEVGLPRHGLLARIFFRLCYSTAHRVVGISQAVVDRLVALNEVPISKCTVIYNPVAIPQIPALLPGGTAVFVTVSRLVAVKNLPLLINAFVQVRKTRHARLIIVGEGPDRPALEHIIESLEPVIRQDIQLTGFEQQPDKWLRQANCFVLLSEAEGLSNALLEAMAVGLAPIATNKGGPTEIIEDGISGWLVDPHHLPDVVSQMNAFASLSDENRARVATEARKRVSLYFSIEAHDHALKQLYSSLIIRRKDT